MNAKTVRVSVDGTLVKAVDRAARALHVSRSAFTRDALRDALARSKVRREEARHREGYLRQPVQAGEFEAVGRAQTIWKDNEAW